jgi:hypothetical protein
MLYTRIEFILQRKQFFLLEGQIDNLILQELYVAHI